MGGTFLAKLLEVNGYRDYNIYDKRDEISCACAWGLVYDQASRLAKLIGYDMADYVLARPRRINVNGEFDCKLDYIVIFDRPGWLNDLWRDVGVQKIPGEGVSLDMNRITVDATGGSKAVISRVNPYSTDNNYLCCVQKRIKSNDLDEDCIYIFGRSYGYAWLFPLGDNWWHYGAGGYNYNQAKILLSKLKNKLYRASTPFSYTEKLCSCAPKIHYVKPRNCELIDQTNNIACVGEAGGLVSGFGEGNETAMRSAKILFDSFKLCNDGVMPYDKMLKRYDNVASEEFNWINEQHEFMESLSKGFWSGLFKALKVRGIAKQRSMNLSRLEMLKVLRELTKTD